MNLINAKVRKPTMFGTYFVKIDGMRKIINYHEFDYYLDRDQEVLWIEEDPQAPQERHIAPRFNLRTPCDITVNYVDIVASNFRINHFLQKNPKLREVKFLHNDIIKQIHDMYGVTLGNIIIFKLRDRINRNFHLQKPQL